MGREIRRVPPGWEHPKHSRYGREEYQPLYDRDFDSEARQWWEEAVRWQNGTHPEYDPECPWFWQWNGDPPDPEYHRPAWTDEERTAFQVYETVSEGTPVTPPFGTKAELVEYLVSRGDFWDQQRGHGGWTREAAESFVADEWAPSLIVVNTPERLAIHSPRDGKPTP